MWLEIVRVRTQSSDARESGREIRDFLDSPDLPDGLADYKIYHHGLHPNEVMLVIQWDSAGPEAGGSELAIRLAFSMKKHGRVDLSTWRPELGAGATG